MTLWLDGDGCPREARTIVFRAAERSGRPAVFVANREIRLPRSPWIRTIVVRPGFDVADHRILQEARPGDVVVTSDIPLAAALVERGVLVISAHGVVFTEENVGERLAVRDLLAGLRDRGEVKGGPAPYGPADRSRLANALDRALARFARGGEPG